MSSKFVASAVGRWAPALQTVQKRFFGGIPAFDYIFRPLFDEETWTYTFLLGDRESREAVLIDPVYEKAKRDAKLCKDLDLKLVWGINTHCHADHVTGTGELKKAIPSCKSVIAKATQAKATRHIVDGEMIKFGKFQLECRSTPGHTDGCMTYVWHEKGMAFTGDALLIRKCGRTDFPQGNPAKLYKSIHDRILSLPDHFVLYPGHDYDGHLVTTVAEEKKLNVRTTMHIDEFVKFMNAYSSTLPLPKKFKESIALNPLDGEGDPRDYR